MVTSQTTSITHTATGSVTVFGFGFYVIEAAALKVRVNGALASNYTVAGLRQNAGGTITFATAPAAGATISIQRETARTQTSQFSNGGSFPGSAVELSFDRLTCIAQEQDATNTAQAATLTDLQGRVSTLETAVTTIQGRLNAASITAECVDGHVEVTLEL